MSTLTAAPAAPLTAPAEAPVRDDPTIWEVDDALWAALRPLLVIAKPRKKSGRPRADDRPIFNGLIWLARTGAQWERLPRRFGPKSTAHARLQEWVAHDGLARAWALLLERYDGEIGLQWEWQAADGCIVKAPLGTKGSPARPRRRAATRPTAANAAPSATC
jgi:putative transposase